MNYERIEFEIEKKEKSNESKLIKGEEEKKI